MGFAARRTLSLWAMCWLLQVGPVAAQAEDTVLPPPSAGTPEEESPAAAVESGRQAEEVEKAGAAWSLLDSAHSFLSTRLVEFVDQVDTFFGDERVDDESRDSFLRFGYGMVANTDGTFDDVSRLRLKVDLPRIEKKLNILFETDGEEAFTTGTAQQDNPVFAGNRSDYSTALRYVVKESSKWSALADAGVSFGNPPDEFLRGRLRRTEAVKDWNFRFTQMIFWYQSKGLGETTQFDIETRAGWNDLLRLVAKATWTDKTAEFDYGQSISLYHELGPRHAMVLSAGYSGESEPTSRVTGYFFGGRVRKRANRRKWLFFELEPKWQFSEQMNFRMQPTLTMSIEAMFGGI